MSEVIGPDARIVLIGGGHAHLLALPILRRHAPRAKILLIDAEPRAIYSGMLPGLIAGHYRPSDLSVDLNELAHRHGADFLRARVTGIDPHARTLQYAGRGDTDSIAYDIGSLDIGSHTAMPELPGFDAHALAVKPLTGFAAAIRTLTGRATVIGGGIAGAEIALALAYRGRGQVTLIEAGPQIAASLPRAARWRVLAALGRLGVAVLTDARPARIDPGSVVLEDGDRIASEVMIGAAGARAPAWLARDLPVDKSGFVRVGPTLQVEGCGGLFAAGDCASMTHAPRPKAGVFAVRQAPILAANLAAGRNTQGLREYRPQRDYLKIMSLGARDAVADWHGITLHGRWLWRWKDRIDRSFMRDLLR